jgi:hypothetical protein
MEKNKIIAIDYKGKYFTLQDNDIVTDSMYEYPLPYIDVDSIISNDELLREHVKSCLYYGISAYHGSNEELKNRIEEIYKQLN